MLINNRKDNCKCCQPKQKTRRKLHWKVFESIKESKRGTFSKSTWIKHPWNTNKVIFPSELARTLFPVESTNKNKLPQSYRKWIHLVRVHGKTTGEWHTNDIRVHTSDIRVHTSDIRMTYEYIRITYEYIRWHTSTYEWHRNDIRVIYEWHTSDIRMTYEYIWMTYKYILDDVKAEAEKMAHSRGVVNKSTTWSFFKTSTRPFAIVFVWSGQ